MWTKIRLLLEEQSDLHPQCLSKMLLNISSDDKTDNHYCDWQVNGTFVHISDDFDLTYRSVLPAEVRGTKNRQLSLSFEPSDGVLKVQWISSSA